ncbi:FecR domain-containing protein [Puniceicoccaceae bacterium K14]|nr:FecR domain-containing protein [Puniceicoccaceae bacterium K14]
MDANSGNDGDRSRIDQEAAEWFIKLDGPLTAEESKAYHLWLEQSSEHAEAYRKYAKTWDRFSLIEDFDGSSKPDAQVVLGVPESRKISRWTPVRSLVALAAVFFLGLFLWSASLLFEDGDSSESQSLYAEGAYENRILADGTIIELNTGARLKISYTDSQRRVWLQAGEAHFHVAKDAQRPFLVYAGETEVKAIGTAFNVKRETDFVQVIVTEGRVLFQKREEGLDKQSDSISHLQQLDAGEFTSMSLSEEADQPVVKAFTEEELSGLLVWKPATLEFASAPLRDVVMAFNKRNRVQIIINDEKIEDMLIEATFRSDNVMAFVRLLELTFDFRVEYSGDDKIIISRSK